MAISTPLHICRAGGGELVLTGCNMIPYFSLLVNIAGADKIRYNVGVQYMLDNGGRKK
jgi:hypothetical protein